MVEGRADSPNSRRYLKLAHVLERRAIRENRESSYPWMHAARGRIAAHLRCFAAKAQIFGSIACAIREGLHMAKDLLSRERDIVVQVARTALTRTIEQYSPPGTDVLPIAAVAVAGMFADLISGLPANSQLVMP
jgi:hypothetical protein